VRRWFVVCSTCVLGVLGLGACRVPYRPLTPREASVDGISAAVEKLSDAGDPAPRIVAAVRFTGAGAAAPPLASAWLAVEGSPRCASGARALANGPDPWSADSAVRDLTFDRATVDESGLVGREPTVLDLDVLPFALDGPRLCVRVPLTDASARSAWSARTRWFLGTGLRLIAPVTGAHDELGDGVVFGLYGGVWLGPARLRLDGEFGQTSTAHPVPAGFGRPVAELLGGAASVEWFPLRLGHLGLGGNIGYEWLYSDFNATMGGAEWNEYRSGPRGPRAMLRVARVPSAPRWPGFSNRRDGWAVGLDLSVARWTGPGALAATFVGLGVGLDTGYWW
jgi:hypothetical protein